jgi:hypothetical protein
MPRPQVIINLNGGLVQDVFSSVPGIQVLVVDWDVEGECPGDPGIVDVPLPDGPCRACVTDFPVVPMSEVAGTDVEAAIDAAHTKGVLCHDDQPCCP